MTKKAERIKIQSHIYDIYITTRYKKVGNSLREINLVHKIYRTPKKIVESEYVKKDPRLYFARSFAYNNIFMKKIFSTFIKSGKKVKVINFYIFFLHYLKNILNKKTNLNLFIYLSQISNKILPIFNSVIFTKRGDKLSLPSVYYKKKKT